MTPSPVLSYTVFVRVTSGVTSARPSGIYPERKRRPIMAQGFKEEKTEYKGVTFIMGKDSDKKKGLPFPP